MATPSRAPRRTAAQMTTNIAQGTPVPGANASTYQSMRKTASAGDGKAACDASHTPVGLTPSNVSINK